MQRDEKVFHLDAALEGRELLGSYQRKHYTVRQRVAEGGMAWVYEAHGLEDEECVALKILFPQFVLDPTIRERFIEEGRIQRRLEHPHIVKVHDLIDEKNILGLALEWMDGGDLDEFIELRGNQPFSAGLIWSLFSPILKAMHCAHEEGIVHRDFKPANVMLKWEGDLLIPKLADFGVAKIRQAAANSKTSTGSVIGTLKYMSPEQLNDSKNVDRRADVYSIGIALYQMATGLLPFVGTTENIIYKQMFAVPTEPVELNPDVEPELAALILKCIEKRPEDRFRDCMELLDALASVPRGADDDVSPEQTVTMCFEAMAKAKAKANPRGISARDAFSHGELDETNIREGGSLPGAQRLRSLAQEERRLSGDHSASHAPGMPGQTTQMWVQEEAPRRSRGLFVGLVVLIVALGGTVVGLLLSSKTPSTSPKTVVRNAASAAAVAVGQGAPKARKAVVASEHSCQPGATRACYPGADGTKGRGLCRAGVQRCEKGKWGHCHGAITPAAREECNGKDDDCDGQVDEDVATKRCRRGKGDCVRLGRMRCVAGRLRCRTFIPKGVSFLTLKLKAKSRFSLRYNGRRRRFRRTSCIAIKRKTKVAIWRKGYQPCTFMASPSTRTLQLHMKRSNGPNALDDDAPNYCTK